VAFSLISKYGRTSEGRTLMIINVHSGKRAGFDKKEQMEVME
jgi:hypothetical protein